MTKAQLQEILKSNILMIATADREDIAAVEDHIETGANLILAPYLARMDDEDEAVLDALYEISSDKAVV
ncbi:MAG: hypothetical protein IJO50_01085, partial [Clostridia bacterium]|nr:hypothetical protein [Clostridia bacterium]